ncbi:MAG: glycosyltransferase family 4 protein [Lamprobacter sp.]|uniref:glycosyltransferase family 4 protein n=1 Tax=Lamprobacter sp. TaxID=3100796 RepID=UPI002B25B7F3|nr:glycosyltransferase family 4 protein [Lamprobacter sp.]MEA3642016.1 glycosyltransferase family 4 protein [Lamprobacter sp.]
MPAEPCRVLLVGPLPPPAGGMAMQTRQLRDLLRAEGLVVELVQVNRPYRPALIARIPLVRALFRLLPYVWSLWHGAGRNDLMHLMANSGWSWHLFAVPAIVIARARGLAMVVNYRGGSAPAFLAQQGAWVLPMLRRAEVLAVPSGFLERVFREYALTARIVPNIVDLSRFMASPKTRGSGRAELRLVVTRNLEPIYDISTALQALALVRSSAPNLNADISLSIAGSGPEADRLQSEALQLGLGDAVTFTGRLDREAMVALYQSADVMLNPSRVDNTPNSILEAWASGVAVVSTNVGGVPDLVTEGRDALLVPPGDVQAMAQAIIELAENPQRLLQLQDEGRKRAQEFSWHRIGPIWLDLYAQLARSRLAP